MKRKQSLFALLLIVSLMPQIGMAKIDLPYVVSNGMVLQRVAKVALWGWTEAGAAVKVDFGGQSATAKADDDGKWMLYLKPMKASAQGRQMTIHSGADTVTLSDILVGEVWLCSGQSNMEWRFSQSASAKMEGPKADHPNLRLFHVAQHVTSGTPNARLASKVSWQKCTPASVQAFTGVGYFFGSKLHADLDVPVGLIESAWGGTRIEPWTPPVGFKKVPELSDIYKMIEDAVEKYLDEIIQHSDVMDAWIKKARRAQAA